MKIFAFLIIIIMMTSCKKETYTLKRVEMRPWEVADWVSTDFKFLNDSANTCILTIFNQHKSRDITVKGSFSIQNHNNHSVYGYFNSEIPFADSIKMTATDANNSVGYGISTLTVYKHKYY